MLKELEEAAKTAHEKNTPMTCDPYYILTLCALVREMGEAVEKIASGEAENGCILSAGGCADIAAGTMANYKEMLK